MNTLLKKGSREKLVALFATGAFLLGPPVLERPVQMNRQVKAKQLKPVQKSKLRLSPKLKEFRTLLA